MTVLDVEPNNWLAVEEGVPSDGAPALQGQRSATAATVHACLALAGLVALAPLLVLIAVAIRVDTPGPAIFRQVRVGRGGRAFVMFKFRTMRAGAEHLVVDLRDRNEHDGLLFKIRDDPRVSRVGRWLRRFSLDELPQLWNVFRGDMALVGPRPPLPDEVANYDARTRRRLAVTPGLTGLWQVGGRADLPWEEAVRLDLHYVDHRCAWLDVRILARTLGAVLRGTGAY